MTTDLSPQGLPIEECLDRWRGRLLDFSGRNRALFYRQTQSTLTLRLSEAEAWRLLSAPGAHIDLAAAVLLPEALAGLEAEPPAVAAALDAARRRMRNLGLTARTFLEEQGVHVLYLTAGWLRWTDEARPPGPSDESVELSGGRRLRLVRSPLLFLPVVLEQTPRGVRLLRPPETPVEPNLALLAYLESVGIEVSLDEEEEFDPAAAIDAFNHAVDGREHWWAAGSASALVDVFSFKKVALLREMERSQDLIAAQPVLRALCGDAEALLAQANLREYDPLDETVDVRDVALSVPADSSQLRAVLSVLDGNSLVVQGPPGTGKSQTITNLVSSLLAKDRTVLFVAEKKAARDVVVSNLKTAGLGEMVLHITEEAVAGRRARVKQDVADQFRAVLEQGPGHYEVEETVADALVSVRDELNAYVRDLLAPLSSAPWSAPFSLFEAWAGCQRSLLPDDPPLAPSILTIDDAWRRRVLDGASDVDDLGAEAVHAARGPWLDMTSEGQAISDLDPLWQALSTLAEAPDEVMALAGDIRFAIPADAGHDGLARLLSILRHLDGYDRRRRSLLRFASPAYWRSRAVVRRFLAQGGREPANHRHMLAQADGLSSDWSEARDLIQSIYPLREVTLSGLADEARDLAGSLPSFEAAQTVLRAILTSALHDDDQQLLRATVKSARAGAGIHATLDVTLRHAWANEALRASPTFALTSAARGRLRQRYAESDVALRAYGVAIALNAVASTRPSMATIAPRESELGILRSQVAARRRKPLRWLFSRAAGAILRLKPCIVASPLAVAQFLSDRAYGFDTVIFDEASQIPTADAVVAISRARQVVVVGDSQQMPPTSFFDAAVADGALSEDTFEFESILQECEALLPSRRLLWHYRSQDERLIAFSNLLFYGGALKTFPSSWAEHPDLGVKFEFVADAVYGRGGSRSNPQEAFRVVDVLARESGAAPEAEVAITAMSIAQGIEVQTRLEEAAANGNERVVAWLDAGNRVKNLETVQGDECDIMILSFGYGKDAAGNLQLNFGPLSREDGYRRLNVAVTRARRKTILVASIRAGDIPLGDVGQGGRLVRQYLDYAERGPIALAEQLTATAVAHYDSPFEENVASALRALGWQVDTQVGVGSYRVDLGIRDPSQPGRYLAGIECDGATYHAAESARDRDIARQAVLQRLGWRIYRVWSPAWFRDRSAVLQDIGRFLAQGEGGGESPGPAALAPRQGGRAFVADGGALPEGARLWEPHLARRPYPPIQEWVARLVEREGPLHEDELLAALRDDMGHTRLGPRIRDQLLWPVREALNRGAISRRGAWYWPAAMDARSVPVRVCRDERRRFEHYPDEELVRALGLACTETGRLTAEQLVEATARFLGFNLSLPIKERLSELVPAAVAGGSLAPAGDFYEATEA